MQEAPPYDGAKNCFLIEDIDDRELLTRLAVATCAELPEPRKTHKK
ncbi:MAG: transcriptional regulator [Oscillospiraceae bacterium]